MNQASTTSSSLMNGVLAMPQASPASLVAPAQVSKISVVRLNRSIVTALAKAGFNAEAQTHKQFLQEVFEDVPEPGHKIMVTLPFFGYKEGAELSCEAILTELDQPTYQAGITLKDGTEVRLDMTRVVYTATKTSDPWLDHLVFIDRIRAYSFRYDNILTFEQVLRVGKPVRAAADKYVQTSAIAFTKPHYYPALPPPQELAPYEDNGYAGGDDYYPGQEEEEEEEETEQPSTIAAAVSAVARAVALAMAGVKRARDSDSDEEEEEEEVEQPKRQKVVYKTESEYEPTSDDSSEEWSGTDSDNSSVTSEDSCDSVDSIEVKCVVRTIKDCQRTKRGRALLAKAQAPKVTRSNQVIVINDSSSDEEEEEELDLSPKPTLVSYDDDDDSYVMGESLASLKGTTNQEKLMVEQAKAKAKQTAKTLQMRDLAMDRLSYEAIKTVSDWIALVMCGTTTGAGLPVPDDLASTKIHFVEFCQNYVWSKSANEQETNALRFNKTTARLTVDWVRLGREIEGV